MKLNKNNVRLKKQSDVYFVYYLTKTHTTVKYKE